MVTWYEEGKNVFDSLNQFLGKDTPLATYLDIYRRHKPSISLSEGVEDTLNKMKDNGVVMGLITDGRSISQRNKMKALGLERWFGEQDVIISEEFGSEKTDKRNFAYFMERYPNHSYWYVGDNPAKDFLVPNRLGWTTVCLLDKGLNIHPQDFTLPVDYLPQRKIKDITELLEIVN
jgi:putative hydrolase of the HAD superfamily